MERWLSDMLGTARLSVTPTPASGDPMTSFGHTGIALMHTTPPPHIYTQLKIKINTKEGRCEVRRSVMEPQFHLFLC